MTLFCMRENDCIIKIFDQIRKKNSSEFFSRNNVQYDLLNKKCINY